MKATITLTLSGNETKDVQATLVGPLGVHPDRTHLQADLRPKRQRGARPRARHSRQPTPPFTTHFH